MVSSGWLLFGEVICAKTKGAEAALKHLFNADQKLVLHLCESSPKTCKFVDDKKVVFHSDAIHPRVQGDDIDEFPIRPRVHGDDIAESP